MNKLAIIITCSHIPSHPSIEIVKQTIESLDRINIPSNTKIILAHDYGNTKSYIDYLYNLQNYIRDKPNITIVTMSKKGYLTGNIKNAMQHIDSDYMLIVQHDLPFIQDINISNIIQDMINIPEMKHVRFNKRRNTKVGSDALNDLFGKHMKGINYTYTRTPSWSDNNHICKPIYYTDIVFKYGGHKFPELSLYNKSTTEAAHSMYGTYLYGPLNHPAVIHHTDGKNYKHIR
jgi:GTP:adenosylcobinamide-phosphate guanylyltransferase